MVKSGLIVGAASLVLILGTSLIHQLCAPCMGFFLGLVAGFLAGVFDKPATVSESLKRGAIAGVIAAGFGLVGSLVGAVINSSLGNPADIEAFGKALGLSNYTVTQGEIWMYQVIFAACTGLINIVWMAILGLAGGAIWHQAIGKKQSTTILPPQAPIQGSY